MWLHDQEYLCSIPVVELPPRNETSEAEARAEEQKELARATDRGWELLQDLEGNCMYLIANWWSYSFCYNSEVTQFHQSTPQPGKPVFPPQRDMATPQYILGRARPKKSSHDDDWNTEVEVRNDHKSAAPTMDLQVKGDTRYLVQKMEGGTLCDLTGKPRRIEIQYHCSPHVTDRIGWIKEVTTCAYLMVIHTPRLCNDVAFLPQKEAKPHPIACRQVVRDDEVAYWKDLKSHEAEISMRGPDLNAPINIGGVILGGGKYFPSTGPKLAMPPNWIAGAPAPAIDVIARKLENNKVETVTDEELAKLDLDPEVVEQYKEELQRMAGDKPWKLEVVDKPGEIREIRGTVDGDKDSEEEDGNGKGKEDEASAEGSEEEYQAHEEL